MTKARRIIKHLLKGEVKRIDEPLDFKRFQELVELAGDRLRIRVRCGRGYDWILDKNMSFERTSRLEHFSDFFGEFNNEWYETEFFGNHQMYSGRNSETHYLDCYQWLRRGNVGPQGCKSHEGTLWFEVPKTDEFKQGASS